MNRILWVFCERFWFWGEVAKVWKLFGFGKKSGICAGKRVPSGWQLGKGGMWIFFNEI